MNNPHGFNIEQDVQATVHNVTIIRPVPPDANGDGIVDVADSWERAVVGNINLRDGGTAFNNVTTGNFGATGSGVHYSGIAMGIIADRPTDISKMTSLFKGNLSSDFRPETPEELLELARPQKGGALDGSWIGAVGRTDFDGYWNPVDRMPNRYGPAPKVTSRFPPDLSAEVSADATMRLEFDQPVELGSGEISLWNVTESSVIATYVSNESPQVRVSGNVLIIESEKRLPPKSAVAVRIEKDALIGAYQTSFEGYSGSDWMFSTAVPNRGYVDSLIPDFGHAVWGAQRLVDGWLVDRGVRDRADTRHPSFDVPAPGSYTYVCDVRPSAGRYAAKTVGIELREISAETHRARRNFVSQSPQISGGLADGGNLPLGDGSYRLFQRVLLSGNRVLFDVNSAGIDGFDFRRPALFRGHLTNDQLLNLEVELPDNSAPKFASEVSIETGDVPVGFVLKASAEAIGFPRPKLSYQWYRDTNPISHATSRVYKTGLSDVGARVFCQVKATNAGGSSDALLSNGRQVVPKSREISVTALPVITPRGGPVGTRFLLTEGEVESDSKVRKTVRLLQRGVDVSSKIQDGKFESTEEGYLRLLVTWENGVGDPVTVEDHVVVVRPKKAAPEGDVRFGQFNAVGSAAFATHAKDGVYGQFTVKNGELFPNRSPLTAGKFDVDGIDVRVIANRTVIANSREWHELMSASFVQGRGVLFRAGKYYAGAFSWNNKMQGIPDQFRFEADDYSDPPVFDEWRVVSSNGYQYPRMNWLGLRFYRPQAIDGPN
ncbi:MAG: Ig-like domain-containing protein, partial [Planctomycetota bacterium]